MKKLLFCMFFFLFFLSKSSFGLENIKVVASIYEPFVYYKDGKIVGFDIDLLDKVCELNGYRYSLEIVPFPKVLEMVSNGEADVGVGAIYVTDERKKIVDFTESYLKTGLIFVSAINFEGDISDLSNKKIGVKKNATGEKLAQRLCSKYQNCEVISFESTEESIEALINKRVNFVLNDYINTHFLMVKHYRGKIFFVKGMFDNPKLITKDKIAFAINKNKKDLFERINSTLIKLKKEKYIDNLLKFWPEIRNYPDIEKMIFINFSFLGLIFIIAIVGIKYYKDRQIYRVTLENERMFGEILNNSPNVVIIHKDDGNITFLNKRFFEVFGSKFKNINNIFELFSLMGIGYEDLVKVKDLYKQLFENKKFFETTGLSLIEDSLNRKIFDIQGAYIGNFKFEELYLTIIRDETYIKELENKYYQAQKLESVGRLAGGIAHDFNNFLTAISGFAYLSILNLDNREEVKKNLEKIISSSEKAGNITKQLLAFSRKQFAKPVVHNINENIKDMEKVIRKTVGEDIEVLIDLQEDLWNVKIDPAQIDQILMNLIVNARDAMPKGGKIIIKTRNKMLDEDYIKGHPNVLEGEYVMLAVEDTGIGMNDEVKSHLFEPFFTTKEKGKGTGLGLATIYGIVKQNNGYIWVYSELGIGTTFKIYFPRSIERELDKQKLDVIITKKESGNILVVEDDDMIREFIANTLKQAGYQVITAENGVIGLEMFEKNQDVSLIISDIIMPKMSGLELIEKIKLIKPYIKFLMMSGYSEEVLIDKKEFVKDYFLLEKPFTALKLIETIKKLI
ncbi:MAG: transporter substrate-binding domain-containing protein [Proteobacteria bacterium]|nr:transporter substrate-binding domain-containing protein [Pseudomonadota bacterium]